MAHTALQPGCVPANTAHSRRRVIAAMIASPLAIGATALPISLGKDWQILQAWHARQTSLAAIESRGSFFRAEWHSPVETEAFDRAEDTILKLDAATPGGVLAKLWTALAHMGGQVRDEDDRAERDLIRRAHLPSVRLLRADMDYELDLMVSAIEALTRIVEG